MSDLYCYGEENAAILERGTGRRTIEIACGGDKSITHRALILATMAKGRSTISNPSRAADCRSTMDALIALGAKVVMDRRRNACVVESPGIAGLVEPQAPLDCRNSGTTARLLMGMLATRPGAASVLTGDASLSERPMKRVAGPLEMMGATVVTRSGGRLPAAVCGGNGLAAIDMENEFSSAQVKSAVMIAASRADGTSVIRESVPTRDHTERLFPAFGLSCRTRHTGEGTVIEVPGGQTPSPANIAVPNDISSAAFFIALAALTEKVHRAKLRIRTPAVTAAHGRRGFLRALETAGFTVTAKPSKKAFCEEAVDVEASWDRGPESGIVPLAIDDREWVVSMIDEIPLLAVVLAHATGTSTISGLSELRNKESDRLAAIADGLRAMGAKVAAEGDSLTITGRRKLRGAKVDARGDHRIAMAFTVAGLLTGDDFEVRGCDSASVSYPGFFDDLSKAGFRFRLE